MFAFVRAVKKGSILIWSGAIAAIPSGWVLCDGGSGTPNLQNLFVIGAGDTYAVEATGGGMTHDHLFIGDAMDYVLDAGADLQGGVNYATTTVPKAATGTIEAGDNMPSYFALAYIMKL